jgi:RimJ/RimL family protein N-acetyltransferase
MAPRTWFPEVLEGSRVVLRRHVPENLAAFRRWYSDPEIARLARYQEAPMRPEEIERFFAARVVGHDALAMAIHERPTDRLVGTCAFSQLDGDNGSALYHITIGEKDAWGRGYGTEATRLMLDHAFGALGLHRIALFVFEFNERAIRTYQHCGFVIEGRARESIFRDGRWWDELAMSVLESDWRKQRESGAEQDREKVALRAEAETVESAAELAREPVGTRSGGRSLFTRTVRRFS